MNPWRRPSQASPSDPAWAAAQRQLIAALKNPNAAYEQFKAEHRPAAAGQRSAQTAEALHADAQRKATFMKGVAFCAAENAKGTNS